MTNTALKQLSEIQNMDMAALKETWMQYFDTEPPKFNRANLERKIAYRIQELAFGGLSPETKENIRRMKQRLEQIATKAQDEETETIINGVKIVENVDENRCQMFFDGKPSDEIRAALKSNGFRWSPHNGCWQRQRSNGATYTAQMIAGKL